MQKFYHILKACLIQHTFLKVRKICIIFIYCLIMTLLIPAFQRLKGAPLY